MWSETGTTTNNNFKVTTNIIIILVKTLADLIKISWISRKSNQNVADHYLTLSDMEASYAVYLR